MKILKKVGIVFLGFLLLASAIFILWAENPYSPTEEAFDALESTTDFLVSKQNDWIVYKPAKPYTSGVIFYPGARVDPRAYAPLCKYLAGEQHLCVIVPMPLNLAIFGINAADDVIKTYSDIHYWVLAGHSLGGSMAARYMKDHISNNDLKGIALLASYSDVDLSNELILATSFRGTNDQILSKDTWENTKKNLNPKYSTFTEIQGGNHSQFGYYGHQQGDGEATISHDEQFRIFQEAIHDMLPGH